MSTFVNGLLAPSSTVSDYPRTFLSAGFASILPLRLVNAHFAFLLGQDWVAGLWQSLTDAGFRIDGTFDAALCLSHPLHPLRPRDLSTPFLTPSGGTSFGQFQGSASTYSSGPSQSHVITPVTRAARPAGGPSQRSQKSKSLLPVSGYDALLAILTSAAPCLLRNKNNWNR
ncbi:hypothetical protein B0H14DRAFT_2563319 [Mycena olivaceomarginata]|nr:hypothetical protein B0H14DRAFT_2563319 [Mycena olivaceomarginata]